MGTDIRTQATREVLNQAPAEQHPRIPPVAPRTSGAQAQCGPRGPAEGVPSQTDRHAGGSRRGPIKLSNAPKSETGSQVNAGHAGRTVATSVAAPTMSDPRPPDRPHQPRGSPSRSDTHHEPEGGCA